MSSKKMSEENIKYIKEKYGINVRDYTTIQLQKNLLKKVKMNDFLKSF